VSEQAGSRCTSETLAGSLGTSASFVRKFLGALSMAGLVKPSAGYQGGVRLGRAASEIRLNEIYSLVTADKRLWATRDNIPDHCFITGNIGAFSRDLCQQAERAVMAMLGEMTVETSIVELRLRDAQRRLPQVGLSREASMMSADAEDV
jgi:Rrf2 family transcriptional repressor of oqxAB